ncbi:MAG: ATP-grasp domain-containing protein [Thaumarchaeota archaeon]|nr:ATP-grasp domain-containing protein [Nitrososphaerota archaeon]
MREKARVLVTASGTIVAQGIIKSLRLASSDEGAPAYRVVAADMSAQAVGLYRGDLGVLVPPALAPDYIDSIINVCKEERIDAIFVGAEEELPYLSAQRKRIEEDTGAVVLINPAEVISVGTDKWRTFEFLKANGLPCADSALPRDREVFVRQHGYPVVVKPREGHGSVHFYRAESSGEIDEAMTAIKLAGWRPILQENLPDETQEFTAGVTIEKGGKRVMSSIAMRRTLKGGQTYRALIDDFPKVRKSAEEVATRLGARGAVNIQSRMVEGEPKAFEINPRFSASCPMRAVAGVNEPDITFRNAVLGEKIKVEGYKKMICMRYWNEVYVPVAEYEQMERGRRLKGSTSFIQGYF